MPTQLREYRAFFERVERREQAVDPQALGLRSKLGGQPDWIQGDETPVCPECNEAMMFVAQIDSIEHDSEDNPHRIDALSDERQYMFGDVGMLYLFFCDQCLGANAVAQCY